MSHNAALTLFVMIDGLRPDALARADCPTLDALRARGASTLAARSVMPSVTLPCHMSIFHSVPPTRHGVVTNDWQPMARPLPGLIDVAKGAGKRCGAIYNWEPLRNLAQPLSLDFAWYRDLSYQEDGDDLTADAAVHYLSAVPLDFAFLYLGTVDTTGHRFGWMSDEYLRQVERIDRQLGRVLAALPEDAHVIVQADHGGHERTHGTEMAEDMTIPWMAAGPQIRRGHTLQAPVSLLDTAPTLARLLGVAAHRDWEGRCVDEAFAG
ncbi:MAG: ectonucleotide pyrophosphatase/phosphodiesterase [Caldilineaceae bacterium]|nr:ectonucleotide pyrophosphatase/phosphodiesterase [Caldilineaceae bacterium]